MWVYSGFLKDFKVVAVATDAGRQFQIVAVTTGKAQLPMVGSQVPGD